MKIMLKPGPHGGCTSLVERAEPFIPLILRSRPNYMPLSCLIRARPVKEPLVSSLNCHFLKFLPLLSLFVEVPPLFFFLIQT